MTTQPLDIEIHRKGRREAAFETAADPDNPEELQKILRHWLKGNKWDKGLWDQFELTAFAAGTWKNVGTVRA